MKGVLFNLLIGKMNPIKNIADLELIKMHNITSVKILDF